MQIFFMHKVAQKKILLCGQFFGKQKPKKNRDRHQKSEIKPHVAYFSCNFLNVLFAKSAKSYAFFSRLYSLRVKTRRLFHKYEEIIRKKLNY